LSWNRKYGTGLSSCRLISSQGWRSDIDLLADEGPLLSEPYTRQLDRNLRELRFHLDRQAVRITYWIASGRRIVLLTAFIKTRLREDREIERARRALARCIAEEHEVAQESEEP
jgi:phage-related protein